MVDLPPPEPSSLRSEIEPPEAPEAPEPLEIADAPDDEDGTEYIHALEALEPEPADEPLKAEAAVAPDDAAPAARAKKNAFTGLEIAAQVHQVQEWLTYGKRPNQIRQLCSEQWGLSTRVAEKRIHDARRQMVLDVNVQDRQEKVGQMLQQLEQVLEQSLAMRQGSNAIGALRLQADLLQLLARQN